MKRNGIFFGQEFLRRQRKERKGEDRERRKKDGMIDETYHAICLKKDSFFILFPSLVFEVTIYSSVQ